MRFGPSAVTRAVSILAALLLVAGPALAEITLTEGTNISVDVRPDGRHVIDLIGGLWLVPAGGGNAARLPNDLHPARGPRFDRTGRRIVYVAEQGQSTELWVYDIERQSAKPIAIDAGSCEQPDWHPDGERVVFAASSKGRGLDLWEVDLSTGLRWRLTHTEGDHLWPTWSDDGRDLVYIRRRGDLHELVLRPLGEPEEVLLETEEALSAPSIRPDGSLVTVIRHTAEGLRIDMVILSSPRLVRTLVEDDDIFLSRIAWRDRSRFSYTANGRIRHRRFDAWRAKDLGFRARIPSPSLAPATAVSSRELDSVDRPSRPLTLRAARLFDGVTPGYRKNVDIVISEGVIEAIEPAGQREQAGIIDLGDISIVPGLVDIQAELPADIAPRDGARLLSFGVTTVVAADSRAGELNRQWASAATPGPRVLEASQLDNTTADSEPPPWLFLLSGDRSTGESLKAASLRWQAAGVPVLAGNWQVGLGASANLVMGGKSLPLSPAGRRYADLDLTNGRSAVTLVSTLAHADTRGLDALLGSRQASGLAVDRDAVRRLPSRATLVPGQSPVVLGSSGNGLPPGVAQQAELLALVEAGLAPADALRAATIDAATLLGLGLKLGRVSVGAEADLLLVAGDPLGRIDDVRNVVGVVRNGRFMSLGRLLDHAAGR
jgi:hypothetical protein